MMKRMLKTVTLAVIILSVPMMLAPKSGAQSIEAQSKERTRPLRPVHTFSIVARDPATGELGVAVQSHWFSVGQAWARWPRNLSLTRAMASWGSI
jgi:hypothetical protein